MNTKMTFQPRAVRLLLTALLAAWIFSGCKWSKPKEGWLVMTKDGKVYQLQGEWVIGHDRYEVVPVDTNIFLPAGFPPCH